MKPELSIIIPAYNEVEAIPALRDALDSYLATVNFSAQIVFVDDGSADDTVELLKACTYEHATVKVVKLSTNFGSHAALRAGIQHADADRCAFYYMDMPDAPEILGQLMALLNEGNELAYTDRINYQATLGSRIYSWLVRRYIEKSYPRDGVSALAFGPKIKQVLNANVENDSSIFFQIFRMGFRRAGIPDEIQPRKTGKSGWTFAKKLKLLIDSFVMFSDVPLRFISTAGIVMTIICGLMALFILVVKIFNLMPLNPGWPTLITLLVGGFGMLLISIGVMSEYLLRALSAARKRPVYLIDEVTDIPAGMSEARAGAAEAGSCGAAVGGHGETAGTPDLTAGDGAALDA